MPRYIRKGSIVAEQWDGSLEGACRLKRVFGDGCQIGGWKEAPFVRVGAHISLCKGDYLYTSTEGILKAMSAEEFEQEYVLCKTIE